VLEPEPVRSLPMEVKEVFSYVLLCLNFLLLCVAEGSKAPGRSSPAHLKIAPLPSLSDSDTHNVAVPLADKNRKKIRLVD
jgi:hypothetical protein